MANCRKRIVFYSQHLVGVGHHFRNREIVRALAGHHDVFFIDGGRAFSGGDLPDDVEVIQLTPVYASRGGLVAEDSERDIKVVLQERQRLLSDTINKIDPDVLIIEFFPFDRWTFRGELISAIDVARKMNPDVKVICSLRDIPMRAKTSNLVRYPIPEGLITTGKFQFYSVPFGGAEQVDTLMAQRYYTEVCPTLNTHFDAVYVHADPQVTRLEEHFPWTDDIEIPVVYTGYVSEKLKRTELNGISPDPFVLVSAGGGVEALELVEPSIDAWKILCDQGIAKNRHMVICTGPFLSDEHYYTLEKKCEEYPIRLMRFVSDFPSWMYCADFSISRAGYNTCMNVLETKTPALLVPSVAMGDQVFRANKLAKLGITQMLNPSEAHPDIIADAIRQGLSQPPITHTIDLDGANKTCTLVSDLSTRTRKMPNRKFGYQCNEQLKVCLITFQYPPTVGGVGVATQRIAQNLTRCGVTVHVIAPGSHAVGEPFSMTMEDNVFVHRTHADLGVYYGDQRTLRDIGSYAVQLHKKVGFDVIHGLFLNPSGLVAANVAKEIDRPFVASIRGSDWDVMQYSPVLSASTRWVLAQANLVTAVSSVMLKKVQKVTGISNGTFISNIFDPTRFDDRTLKEIGGLLGRRFFKAKQERPLVIGTVASISYKKGHSFLLEAFHNFLNTYSNALLLMVGDYHTDRDRGIFTKQVEQLGLANRIFITGSVPHVQVLAWMKEMDIFAFPSLHEGSPNALLEAMSCGLPVIASEVGGICDLIQDGQNGLLVPSFCAQSITEKLILYTKDIETKLRMGQSAAKTIAEHFTPVQEAKAWVAAYKRAIVNAA